MQTFLTLLLAAAMALPAVQADDEPDTVVLKTGKSHTGRLVYRDAEIVVLRQGSKEKEFAAEDVAEVRSVTNALGEVLDRLAEDPDMGADTLLELAAFCEDEGLTGERHVLLLKALLKEPLDPEVNEALGNREKKGEYEIKIGNKRYDTNGLSAEEPDFGDAWELETTHYIVRSNERLGEALDAILDLERYYRDVYAFLREGLALRDFIDEKLQVEFHADEKSYPEPGDGRLGFFDTSTRIIHIATIKGDVRELIVHEGMHQILFMTTRRAKSARGAIPAWVDEGLATYLEEGVQRRGSGRIFELGVVSQEQFDLFANADDTYDLSNVLNWQTTDFMASSGRQLKYAEAYTLIHFLLHAENGLYRERFFDYLDSAYLGKSSMTEFQKIMDMKDDEIEDAWTTYVQMVARET